MTTGIRPEELEALLAEAATIPKPEDSRYTIEVGSVGNCLLVIISGMVLQPIPTEFSNRLESIIARGAGRRVIVDLALCDYISSAVIGTLVSFFGATTKAGGQMIMVRPPAKVEMVLRAVALDQFFLIVDSLQMAVDFFQAQSGTRPASTTTAGDAPRPSSAS